MMKRKIIEIDEDLCNGCGQCIPNCPEGALQVIDGKARLVSDLFCDGLGACIGHCPTGAIEVIEREAERYDERRVMENIVKQGKNTIKAHLKHLKDHGETALYSEATEYLSEKGIENPLIEINLAHPRHCACPGSREMNFFGNDNPIIESVSNNHSELKQWPIQMHLVSENAGFFKNADILISADCVGYADPNLHNKLMKGKAIAICCPKLDDTEYYYEKIKSIILLNNPKSITVAVMEVPCCSKLYSLVESALEETGLKIPLKRITVKINGTHN